MLSSVSSPGGSRSRRTSSSALRRSRSSAWPTGPARRPRSECGAGSHRPSSTGRATASSSTSRRPTCGRKGRASTCRSRWRCSPLPARSRSAASPATPPSASSRSTAGCGPCPGRWSRPKARGGTARDGSCAPPSRGRRSRSRGSSRSRSAISPRRSRTSAATGIRRLRPAASSADRSPVAARPGGRARSGARPPRARDRRRRRSQPAARRPARDRQDDARPPAARDPAAARRRGGARGHADPLDRGRARRRAPG